MNLQEWKFRRQMQRQRRRQKRYDKAVEKCRKAAERDGIAFDRLWVIYDPANQMTALDWLKYSYCIGHFLLLTMLVLWLGFNDHLP